jgi:hypothetical protein
MRGTLGLPRNSRALYRMEQQIHFCTTADGARIAYATVGEGPPLFKAANWLKADVSAVS